MADQSGTAANNGPLDREAARARLAVLENVIFSTFSPSELSDRADHNSSARTFLESRPIVETEDRPETCHICKEEFFDNPVPGMGENGETALRLPCNHILGADCLKKWFETDNNTCPLCRSHLFGSSQQDGETLHAAISEFSTLLSQQTGREQSEALTRLMRDNNLDMMALSVLTMETRELMARLDELNAAPDTEENRAAVSRIARMNTEITAQLEEVENRIRERQS